ncbi:DUF4345 domain-containing protein [Blastococcus sp. TML/M2B]|uniref:DUF4345 domain-containing protein n=1 Tax=unclassified Blastococcus TaxID=2619396 RepID=UPI00190ADE25|nr:MULTISPECIES: DUF4345 domain-containing protein [unclassified Blastococcus]MBN1094377.1 DUF4345 domain-containing protein [Blastococcus sp. TML/M2B]MBN1095338.1 DUF4345 domain-containing protein [Blastococcus sp. TML/C7B]
MTSSDGGRRGLQITLSALAAIPLASGLAGALVGPSSMPGAAGPATPDVESEYRYAHAIYAAAAPLIWSAVPQVERRGALVRGVSGALFAGGVVRLLAWRRTGRPSPALVGAAALELLGTPVLVAWQHRVARRAGR